MQAAEVTQVVEATQAEAIGRNSVTVGAKGVPGPSFRAANT